jgi:hypothetical protein
MRSSKVRRSKSKLDFHHARFCVVTGTHGDATAGFGRMLDISVTDAIGSAIG